ncbi:MAG: TatD family hydrolase, partial [Nitrososphaerales archaeon]
MLIDAHAHLNEPLLAGFVNSLEKIGGNISVYSNSVDLATSVWNIQASNRLEAVVPFVGIHPEIFSRSTNAKLSRESLDQMVEKVGELFYSASGIGEIGLDPNYGRADEQAYLLTRLLDYAEDSRLPISFHCRNTFEKILDTLSSHTIHGNLLFHWFAGSESDLKRLHDNGIYTSFGPSILFSKRMARLVETSDAEYILAETDSPTIFRSIIDHPTTPFIVSSVIFKMSLIRKVSFEK